MKDIIEKITHDASLTVDRRIEAVLAAREANMPTDDDARLEADVECLTCLIEMLRDENAGHAHDEGLLEMYALLAGTYVQKKDYRPMRQLAQDVIRMIRYEDVAYDDMAKTVPDIIDAVGETVYSHALYEMLLAYVSSAHRAGRLDAELKGRVRRMLKLRLLLDETAWCDTMFDKGLQEAVAAMFTSDELLKIMLRPQIGHLRKDPVEYTWQWENAYYDVEERLADRFANAPRHMGFCFLYWSAKAELLKDDYGIDWKSPSLMNPRVIFD